MNLNQHQSRLLNKERCSTPCCSDVSKFAQKLKKKQLYQSQIRKLSVKVQSSQVTADVDSKDSTDSTDIESIKTECPIEQVQDIMTGEVITCTSEETIDNALEKLVAHRIAGMPVIDENNKIIGIVSDYDLLALDEFGSDDECGVFPTLEDDWSHFNLVKRALQKVGSTTVGEVMCSEPVTVRENTSVHEATRLLLEGQLRRLPVVDKDGKLVGLLSRGNVIRSVLAQHQALKLQQNEK